MTTISPRPSWIESHVITFATSSLWCFLHVHGKSWYVYHEKQRGGKSETNVDAIKPYIQKVYRNNNWIISRIWLGNFDFTKIIKSWRVIFKFKSKLLRGSFLWCCLFFRYLRRGKEIWIFSPAGRYDQFTAFGCWKKSSDIADKERAPGFQVFNASSTSRRVVNAFYKQRREILFTKKEENVKMFTKLTFISIAIGRLSFSAQAGKHGD